MFHWALLYAYYNAHWALPSEPCILISAKNKLYISKMTYKYNDILIYEILFSTIKIYV